MTTFKEIRGTTIQVVSSDPSNPETGQIWYNSSSGTLKGYALANVNAFSAGGNLPASVQGAAGFGTQTAGLIAGGSQSPGSPQTGVLLYNGTSWSPTTAFNTNRGSFGAIGVSQTAGIIMGGYVAPDYSTATESWNGSSWTTVNTLNIARGNGAAIGTSTAGLWGVGDTPAGDSQTSFSAWNGTSWTSAPNTNTGRNASPAAFGTQTAGIIAGGRLNPSSNTNATESYNGSAWTTVNSLNTTRRNMGSAGTQTAGLAFGGATGPSLVAEVLTGATELWNGTSWTSNPTGLATARRSLASVGTSSLAFGAGGYNAVPGITNATEEWTGVALQVRTITVS